MTLATPGVARSRWRPSACSCRGACAGGAVSSTRARSFASSTAPNCDFTEEQLEFLANIVRLYRGEEPETAGGENELFAERFPNNEYLDVPGLCKVATLAEIESQGWSLNPGRYVGTETDDLGDEVFEEKLAAAHAELRDLAARAAKLEQGVDHVLTQLLSR